MEFSLSKLYIEEFILVESKGLSAGWVPPPLPPPPASMDAEVPIHIWNSTEH
jgi:hypothetical protein